MENKKFLTVFSSLQESVVDIISIQPWPSRSIGTPFIKPDEEFHWESGSGLFGNMYSLEAKLACPSLIAIWAPESEFSKSLVE